MKGPFRFLPVILLCGIGLAYYTSLDAPLSTDDTDLLQTNPAVANPSNFTKLLGPDYFAISGEHNFRPLPTALVMLERQLWGNRVSGYRFVALILHFVNALLLAVLLDRMGFAPTLQVVACLFFAFHPAQSETLLSVVYGSKELLLGFFSLTGILSALSYFQTGRPGRILFSFVCLVLASLSKETGLALAFLIPLIGIVTSKKAGPLPRSGEGWGVRVGKEVSGSRHQFGVALGSFFLLALYLATIFHWRADPSGDLLRVMNGGLLERIAMMGKILPTYLGILIFPWNLKLAYFLDPFSVSSTGVKVLAVGSLLIIMGLAVFLVMGSWRRDRKLIFFWVWIALTLGPAFNIYPALKTILVAERYLYVPLLGISALFGWILCRFPKRLSMGVTFVLSMIFLGLVYSRAQEWKDQKALYRDLVADAPGAVVAHTKLATLQAFSGDYRSALPEYEKALSLRLSGADKAFHYYLDNVSGAVARESALRPYSPIELTLVPLYSNLGVCHQQLGHLEEAEGYYKAALSQPDQSDPAVAMVYSNLTGLYATQGRWRESEKVGLAGLRLERRPDLLFNLAVVYNHTGRYAKALEMASAGLSLRPDNPNGLIAQREAYQGLGQHRP